METRPPERVQPPRSSPTQSVAESVDGCPTFSSRIHNEEHCTNQSTGETNQVTPGVPQQNNTQAALISQYFDLHGEQSMLRMGNSFNTHENPQSICPCHSPDPQDGQPMMGIGTTFNMHQNPQTMLPLNSLGLQDGQPMMDIETTFNMHQNPQTMLPLNSLGLQDGQPVMDTGGTFNTHDDPQSTLPLQPLGQRDAQGVNGIEGSMNSTFETRGSQIQVTSDVPHAATPPEQQTNFAGCVFVPPVLVT